MTSQISRTSNRDLKARRIGVRSGWGRDGVSRRSTGILTSEYTRKVSQVVGPCLLQSPLNEAITVVGRKSFNILPPAAKALLDPSTNPLQGNTSIIPISIARIFADTSDSSNSSADDPPPDEIQRYRKQLKEAFELPGACQVDLAAGESVLVPEGWFHSAEGIGGPGVGVGAWFR